MAEKMDKNLDYNAKPNDVVIDANKKLRVGLSKDKEGTLVEWI